MAKKTNTEINGNKYYRVTATIGKEADGKLIRKQFYGSSKKEAEAKRDEYLFQLKKGLAIGFDKIKFIDIFEKWFFDIWRNTVSHSTFIRNESVYRLRIKTCSFASLNLTELKSMHIQSYYNSLLKNCTPTTIKFTHNLLSRFFIYCLKTDLIIKNPLVGVALPKEKKVTVKYKFISKKDVNKIVDNVKNNNKNFIYVFALFTGIRLGEILALQHKDIDLENNIIKVNKSLSYLKIDGEYKHILSHTKTKSSVRDIPILEVLIPFIETHIVSEKEKHMKLGKPFSNEAIFFSSHTCSYRLGANVDYYFKKLLQELHIQKTNFHSLRHTFCSMLAENSVSIKTASVLMGHSNISMTANIYTHVNLDEKKKSIQKLSSIF